MTVHVTPRGLRPRIHLKDGKYKHSMCGPGAGYAASTYSVRVEMRRGLISVGCTDITPEAARKLLAEYDRMFPTPEQPTVVVVQEGP